MSDQKTVEAAVDQQPSATSAPVTENTSNPMEEVDSGEESLDVKDTSRLDEQLLRNPMDEIDTEGEDGDTISPIATVVPSNTPVTGDSGQGSPTMQSSSESLSDEGQQDQTSGLDQGTGDGGAAAKPLSENVNSEAATAPASSKGDIAGKQNENASPDVKGKVGKEGKKEEKKEEKKKGKKKEDKGIEYILRALNSLQSPEEKLAALCKKYADLHEEHRVLQSSFKTQQRTMSVVMREKDQLQSEHTKAMMAKSKLESLCRELQKHNKIIKDESIKRAKEDDEKRKEISSHFTSTIGEIQSQMNENSERNSKLRQENENLAAQLRAFIQQCEARDQHVEKLQKQHELEKKLAEAKLAQAEAIMKEHEERTGKEKELMLLKLTESGKKTHILEAQVAMFKERYDEFEKLHSRSNETFQKYKTEMDKMTKRIKKLEKDGVSWKTKWEASNKALLEQMEARNKLEKETLVYAQKTKKLESLCRALQAELHGKKVDSTAKTEEGEEAKSSNDIQDPTPSTSAVPPNSPEASSSDQCSPDSGDPKHPSLVSEGSAEAESQSAHPADVPSSSSESASSSSPTQETATSTAATTEACQSSLKEEGPSIPAHTDTDGDSHENKSVVSPVSSSLSSAEATENMTVTSAPSEVAA